MLLPERDSVVGEDYLASGPSSYLSDSLHSFDDLHEDVYPVFLYQLPDGGSLSERDLVCRYLSDCERASCVFRKFVGSDSGCIDV